MRAAIRHLADHGVDEIDRVEEPLGGVEAVEEDTPEEFLDEGCLGEGKQREFSATERNRLG